MRRANTGDGHNRCRSEGDASRSDRFRAATAPYAENTLEPVISAKTLRLHYGKHDKGYVDTLNQLVAGTLFADMSLKQLVFPPRGNPSTPRSSTTRHRLGTTRSIGAV